VTDFLPQGRAYLAEYFGTDCSHLPAAKVVDFLDKHYFGGWFGFKQDYRQDSYTQAAFDLPVESKESGKYTSIAHILRVTQDVQFRLGPLDQIENMKETDSTLAVTIECYETTQLKHRIRIHKKGLRLISWKKIHGFWKRQPNITFWDEEFVPTEMIGQYSRVNTEERFLDQADQAQSCWRPGTSQTPMDGDVVRERADELVHKYIKHKFGSRS
jgi:hypothetical protein